MTRHHGDDEGGQGMSDRKRGDGDDAGLDAGIRALRDTPPSADLTPDLVNLAQVLALATRTAALNATLSRSTARFRDYSETVSDWFWETDA